MRYAPDRNWEPEITTSPFTYLLDTTKLTDGYYNFYVYARDAQNNVAVTTAGFVVKRLVCSYALSTTGLNVGATASSGSIGITSSSADCPLASASSAVPWATTTTNGDVVNWLVSANPSSLPRSGTLTVVGETVPIVQSGASCSYALSSANINVSALFSSGTITVMPTPSDCPTPLVTSSVSWASASISGNTLNWSVTANIGSYARNGLLSIGGQTVSIVQKAVPVLNGVSCIPGSVTPPNATFCLVWLSAPAFAPGATISLASSSNSAIVPLTTTVQPGSFLASFRLTLKNVLAPTALTLTASYLGISKTAGLVINPATPTTGRLHSSKPTSLPHGRGQA
jgi:hypothetical protein